MPTPQRRHAPAVIEQLLAQPQQFGFFQAVRLLARWLSPAGDAVARRDQGLARLSFRSALSLAFAPGELAAVQVHPRGPQVPDGGAELAPDTPVAHETGSEARPHARPAPAWHPAQIDHIALTPSFIGMLGSHGALPLCYTEMLLHRGAGPSEADGAQAFIDLFGDRAVSLYYQAWRKHRLPYAFEADSACFMPWVLALVGRAAATRTHAPPASASAPWLIPSDTALAFHAGALQQKTTSVQQLKLVLQRQVGVPVRVVPFVGRWYALPAAAHTHLGRAGAGALAAPGRLGRSATLGERVWQRDLCARLVLGPLDPVAFRRLLPGQPGAQGLQAWLGVLGGAGLSYEVNLLLQRQAIEACGLRSGRDPAQGCLGWDTFLQTRPAQADRVDVRYDLSTAA